MERYLSILLTVLCLVSYVNLAPTDCTPFGMRIALGRNYWSVRQTQTVSIWFNTGIDCPKSYTTVQTGSSITKVNCLSNKLTFDNYSSWVHRCSVDVVDRGSNFEYMAFGWTGNASDPIIPARSTNYKVHLIGNNQNIQLVAIGDWGYLNKKAGIYDRLDDAFNGILNTKQNYIFYIGGDYAYDLSSHKGKNYQEFITMLSQVGSVWPCILIPGNHEYNTPNDFMLYKGSFEIYNIIERNVTSLDLQAFTLIILEPYGIVFHNETTQNLLREFKKQLQAAPKNKPIITCSHYPLACSGQSSHCRIQRVILKEFFDLMIDFNVVLHVGSHYHTYERISPFMKNGEFKLVPSPYIHTKETKFLPSIVQGIAGNDQSIVESYDVIQNYTAALSYNHTGFGIMKIGRQQLSYQHFLSTAWQTPVDSMIVRYSQLFNGKHWNLRED